MLEEVIAFSVVKLLCQLMAAVFLGRTEDTPWQPWSTWGPCSQTCNAGGDSNGGFRRRARSCAVGAGKLCGGEVEEGFEACVAGSECPKEALEEAGGKIDQRMLFS